VLQRAQPLAGEFARLTANIPYERKGILFSEMLFAYAILNELRPKRILESGRARGQSTHLVAACFPATPIISIEFDANSPDVAVAAARLRGYSNVELLFGDATSSLPKILRSGDAVMIDGPKGFRALRSGLRLLSTGLPVALFLHDCARGSVEREFLTRSLANTLYSDEREFVRRCAYLDQTCADVDPAVLRPDTRAATSYGPTFACAFPARGVNYSALLVSVAVSAFLHRMARATAKTSTTRT
jgi:hypothetical protein